MLDSKTAEYFNRHTPVYSKGKYKQVIDFIASCDGLESRTLLDIGCAQGQFLSMVSEYISPDRLFGVDIAENYLDQCSENIPGVRTFLGSVADDGFMGEIRLSFDFVTIGAVLHHVVAKNRRDSMRGAEKAIINAWKLVKSDGFLIIEEPTYSPEYLMSMLFYVKKIVTGVTLNRIEIGRGDNNIGPPIVSYLSHDHLRGLATQLDNSSVIIEKARPRQITRSWRLAGVRERFGSLLVLQNETPQNKVTKCK